MYGMKRQTRVHVSSVRNFLNSREHLVESHLNMY
jgi:hypothetical protein